METTAASSIRDVSRAAALGVLVDLDGTLIPIAETPGEARADEDVLGVIGELARAPGTRVTIVSGRPRASLEELLGPIAGVWLVAEHGAWRRDESGWHALPITGTPPDAIEHILARIVSPYAGAFVERKTWSVCLHYRRVRRASREALLVEATHAMNEWIARHPEYELLDAAEALEVRHRAAHKGSAVAWMRDRLGAGSRLIALGDDLTDEDTFAALGPEDASILVGTRERPTHASARLDDPLEVRGFLRWLARQRTEPIESDDARLPRGRSARREQQASSLVVVSNRMPDVGGAGPARAKNVGGLVAALEPALAERGGLWLGWSGRVRHDGHELAIDRSVVPARASFDFEPRWQSLFYNGFANRSLWPLFHSFPTRAHYDEDEWRAYVEVNDVFARSATELAAKDGMVWVHDYHLLLVAAAMRRRGFEGKIGFFLHIPFPSLDLFETIPWASVLLDGLLSFDLVGFHTHRYASNFVTCAREMAGVEVVDGGVRFEGRLVRVGVFPLGIDPAQFEDPEEDEASAEEIGQLQASLGDRKLVLGVDRLDYTKGIPQRLEAFSRMLELFPEWRAKVSFVQVAVPSRADVPEYAEQRTAIETLVGHINGEHGEAHWVPVRYVYRSYGRAHLARLYRAADVCIVSPLRDGMNLVAKEYVAAQDPTNPGVLLLSRFAGAAEELHEAMLTNPYHREGMARDLARSLAMSHEERVARHALLLAKVRATTSASWANDFLAALATAGEHASSQPPVRSRLAESLAEPEP